MKSTAKIPEGSMRKRREAMDAMVEAGKSMLKAQGTCGVLPLPEKYNVVARQVQELIQWRKRQVFKVKPRNPEELI
jgi:hypothetical protein